MSEEEWVLGSEDAPPLGFFGNPDAPVRILLAHGAGAGMKSDFMRYFAHGLAESGHRVVLFDFPYMHAGRKAPDKQPVLEATFRRVIDELEKPERLVIGGKSLGGRIASYVAASGVPLFGLLLLGYPLHPPGRPDRLRVDHFPNIDVPTLFVEGTRDPFCPLETLEKHRSKIPARSDLLVIDDGDHSLKVRKSSGRDTQAAWHEAVEGIVAWLSSV